MSFHGILQAGKAQKTGTIPGTAFAVFFVLQNGSIPALRSAQYV
jgi:hypothetical protein